MREKTEFTRFSKNGDGSASESACQGRKRTVFPLAKTIPSFCDPTAHRDTVTWNGHATLLLQMDGLNILTDPQFSLRASPFQCSDRNEWYPSRSVSSRRFA